MLHHVLRPRQALNKAYLKQKTPRADMEQFKEQLRLLLDRLDPQESEEHAKNHLRDFLTHTGYAGHAINTKGRTDLVIHLGPGSKSPAGVLMEVKRPTNKADMPTPGHLNARAIQELLLYYLRERLEHRNHDLKHLVVTSVHEWFVFDALEFDRVFFRKGNLRQHYLDWSQGRKAGATTDYFYRAFAAPAIAQLDEPLTFAHFNLLDYEKPLRNHNPHDDVNLVALIKLLSPAHLLKLPFANDSNSLDKAFYTELLHLIGLTETKEGGKKLIGRKQAGQRHPGSLLENTIDQLETVDKIAYLDRPHQYGKTHEERVFSVALELCITWINRILFLKLLEAQLLTYHAQDPAYAFLSFAKVRNFDDLNSLFFRVLARRPAERAPDVQALFRHVPYLNSSLFEATELEHRTLLISNLRDEQTLPVLPGTVLKEDTGKKRTGTLSTLAYLFAFLDAYDFSSEGAGEIQEENKSLINASVLGLIFEKINGYRDGSFFTPGFITMYMCRETIRRAVVQKFNAAKNWNCTSVAELYDSIDDRAEANRLVNSIRLCDPAVGSGHFLVSALNELIALKSDLRILQDRQGRRLKEYTVEVVNDELIVTDEEGQPFVYRPHSRESQRVQEALFHEKQTLIESCLFGVDINPNSVKICRLRLWIELLKHAYYGQDGLNQNFQNFRISRMDQGVEFSEFSHSGNSDSDTEFSSPVCYANTPGLREGFGPEGAGELQTLPNIDINIKVGNSLISRFALDADLRESLRKSKWNIGSYKLAVQTYQHARSKEEKREMEALINTIKGDFRTEIGKKDKRVLDLRDFNGEFYNLTQQTRLFDESAKQKQVRQKRLAKLEAKINKLSAEIEEIKSNKLYENAFEWRFEFPEVLNEEGDFVGFDVVIGNPPYIRQEELGEAKEYLQQTYATYAGTADLYVYFVEKGVELLKQQGHFAYILPNKWLRAGYGLALRKWLKQHRLLQMLDFGDLQVFEEATTYPLVLELQKSAPEADYTFDAAMVDTLDFDVSLAAYAAQRSFAVKPTLLPDEGWSLSNSASQLLLEKLKQNGVPLGEYVQGKIYRGVLTGLNEAFVIDEATKERLIAEDPRSAEVIKPFLAGRDVKRYQVPRTGKYLILFPRGITKEKAAPVTEAAAWQWLQQSYSALANHLAPFAKKAAARCDKGDYWWELRACVYYDEFEKPKITIPSIVKSASYAFDPSGIFSNDKTSIIPLKDFYLLGILNSSVVDFFFKSISSTKQGGYFEYKPVYVSQLPIATGDEETKETIRALVQQILTAKQADPAADTTALEAEIDRLVYGLYGLTEEEIALVEGSVGVKVEKV